MGAGTDPGRAHAVMIPKLGLCFAIVIELEPVLTELRMCDPASLKESTEREVRRPSFETCGGSLIPTRNSAADERDTRPLSANRVNTSPEFTQSAIDIIRRPDAYTMSFRPRRCGCQEKYFATGNIRLSLLGFCCHITTWQDVVLPRLFTTDWGLGQLSSQLNENDGYAYFNNPPASLQKTIKSTTNGTVPTFTKNVLMQSGRSLYRWAVSEQADPSSGPSMRLIYFVALA
ncbi:hypothetical protein EVAR_34201_1 [Eumeta japonica]|uniref:Uncharacterized protein n=1 Tax=Eumeta variegata TaxID=151549 RepID=A0A4C1WI25_EUMVA|nr:hypothetical protein EVAR_34201_1 [Eumeta japonica]